MLVMRLRRLVRSVPAGLLAVALLAACGDETGTKPDSSDSSDRAADSQPTLTSRTLAALALDVSQATTALLAQQNMPAGFDSLGPSSPDEPAETETDGSDATEGSDEAEETDETGESTGCETEESFEDRFDRGGLATTRTDTGYLYVDEARLLIVTSLVASFADDAQAGSAFDAVRGDFESCTHYEETDAETGETTVVDVTHDGETATGDVDDQLNLLGNGLWSSEGFDDVEMGFGLSLARVDGNVTLTQVMSLGVAADNELLAPYTGIAVDRLVAVMNGETPEELTGPAPAPVTITPTTRLPLPLTSSPAEAYRRYFDIDPRFSLPG